MKNSVCFHAPVILFSINFQHNCLISSVQALCCASRQNRLCVTLIVFKVKLLNMVTLNLHGLAAQCITMADPTRKSVDRLAWSTVLWKYSIREYGIIDIYADGQRFEVLSQLYSLAYCVSVGLGHWIITWYQVPLLDHGDVGSNQRLLHETEARSVTS